MAMDALARGGSWILVLSCGILVYEIQNKVIEFCSFYFVGIFLLNLAFDTQTKSPKSYNVAQGAMKLF